MTYFVISTTSSCPARKGFYGLIRSARHLDACLIYKIFKKYVFEPVARVPQLVARLLAAEYRLELRATDRLLASPVGPTKSSQKSSNTQPCALSTGSAVFVLRVLPTKSRPNRVKINTYGVPKTEQG